MKFYFKKRAFTLIELLVVIVIIGVLSAIGISSFQGFQAKARDSKRVSDVQQLAKVLFTATLDGAGIDTRDRSFSGALKS